MPRERFDFREWSTELSRVPTSKFYGTKKQSVLAIAAILRNTCRADGTNAHLGLDRLAEQSGLSRPTVRAALGWLVDNRWIRRRTGAGRLADAFDLLPAEIPLANEAVDLADFPPEGADEAVDDELARLSDLWRSTSPDVPVVGKNLPESFGPVVGKNGGLAGKNLHANDAKLSPKYENDDAYLGSSSEEPSGARTRAHAREAPPDGLLWTGDVDRWGQPRYADRLGNRLATDAEIADAYRRRHVAGVDPRALEHVRQVRSDRGWKPGPTASPPDAPPPWADPAFAPFDAPPNPDNVEWLDDRRNDVASGAPIRTHKGAGPPKTETPVSRDVPKPVIPEDNGCTHAPEAITPDGEPF